MSVHMIPNFLEHELFITGNLLHMLEGIFHDSISSSGDDQNEKFVSCIFSELLFAFVGIRIVRYFLLGLGLVPHYDWLQF